MSFYMLAVKDGTLMYARLENGALQDHQLAVTVPSLQPRLPNLVDFLDFKVDYSPLGGLLLDALEGTYLPHMAIDVAPRDPLLAPRGARLYQTYTPHLSTSLVTVKTAQHLTDEKLWALNQQLILSETGRALSEYTGTPFVLTAPLSREELPTELEFVVANYAEFRHWGETFKVTHHIGLIGLHELSVAAIEQALTACPRKGKSNAEALQQYKAVSAQKRQLRGIVRSRIGELTLCLREGCKSRREFESLLQWSAMDCPTGSAPAFVSRQIGRIESAYRHSPLPGIDKEFESLWSDITEKIREILTEANRKAARVVMTST